MSRPNRLLLRGRIALVVLMAGLAWSHQGRAALFEDDEARRAILDVRQRVEANRQASETALQRLVDANNELLRRMTEDNAQLRRSMLDLQNQIESLRGELARSNGQHEQMAREVSELQRAQKDIEPVSDAEADGEAAHQLDHHPPALAGGRVVLVTARFRSPGLPRRRDPLLKRLQAAGIGFAGHRKGPLGQLRDN